MSTVASLHIETWGGKFIVVGQFRGLTEIPRREYDTYGEALKELSRAAQREEVRYANNISRGIDRQFDGD